MNRGVWKNLELKTAGILLILIALLTVCLYLVFYTNFYDLTISNLQDEASIIHTYAEDVIDEASFTELKTIDDEQTQLYIDTRMQLNEIRRIANILYLYTAKVDDSGNFIYVVDGIFEEDIREESYFCHIGHPIEDAIAPLLERALNGEIVLGDKIISTEWGVVYAAYFPFRNDDGDVIGAIGMEFDCERLNAALVRTRGITIIIASAISIVFIIMAYTFVKRFVHDAVTAYTAAERGKAVAEDTMRSIMNASPMPCQYWGRDHGILDCNEASLALFGYQFKQDYIDRWKRECNPEYQPDGQNSSSMGHALLEKAFAEGTCEFSWMFQLPDGAEMPARVTLVRVNSGNDSFIAGYIHDLRKEKELEARTGDIYKDPLTGFYSKPYLETRLAQLINTLSRCSGELSVILASVDFLNPYYSAYGVSAGENCVKTVAGALRNTARRTDDFVVRYRDDEFVIVLPNTGKAGAILICEKLKEAMQDIGMPHIKNAAAPHVTLSFGVTSGKVLHRQRPSDYVNRAEEMLYLAKRNGRNGYSYADL